MKEEIQLEPDHFINGALAFRLGGSKTRGSFVQYVNKRSTQSNILYEGDQILKVNGVDVRRLTCDQIANILRVAVRSNGYAFVQVSRRIRREEVGEAALSEDENGNLHYTYPTTHVNLANDDNGSATLPLSLSGTDGSSESASYAREVTPSIQCRHDVTGTECAQSVCFSEESDRQFSLCTQQWKFRTFGYAKQLYDSGNDCAGEAKSAECSKYSTKWRWHIVKHRWATSAMRLLPKSASDFLGLRIYQKAYYNLI